MVKTRSSKRRRLMSISSNVSTRRPDLPAIFESLNDDTLTTILEFVGDKSYRSFGGLNYQCREVYLNTPGMTKETFVYGYAPLSAIINKIERGEQTDPELRERVGKGVLFYNRSDVLAWALQERKSSLLRGICIIAGEEGRFDLLIKVWNYIDDENANRYIFQFVNGYAARYGKLSVLQWLYVKELPIDKGWCAGNAAHHGHLNILQWLQEEQGLELDDGLYYSAIYGGQLHVMKWLREQGCPWDDDTFQYAAQAGNLEVLLWLHDEGCPWPEYNDGDEELIVYEEDLTPCVLDWLRENGYGDRIV